MKNLSYKIGASFATAGLLTILTATSAFAAVDVKVKGNGSGSYNKVVVGQLSVSGVKQKNNSLVINDVSAKTSTGKNTANGNTGGTTSIDTGDANTTVGITVTGNSNTATNSGCGCPTGDVDVTVADNGSNSVNKVYVLSGNVSWSSQKNNSVVINGVNVKTSTGGNEAKNNTNGDVGVTTGDATTDVTISVAGGTNTLN